MATRYWVIREYDQSKLEAAVTRYISKGWQLQGGVSVYCRASGFGVTEEIFFQAMIKD